MPKKNDELINQMVQDLMAVPSSEATQGDVILAFCKATALVARMIGEMRHSGDDILQDMLEMIESYYDTQTVIVQEYSEH